MKFSKSKSNHVIRTMFARLIVKKLSKINYETKLGCFDMKALVLHSVVKPTLLDLWSAYAY